MIFISFVALLLNIYFYMLIAKVVLSWIPDLRGSRVERFISYYTDPYLNLFRGIIPPIGMIDISPMIAFFAYYFIQFVTLYILVKIIL